MDRHIEVRREVRDGRPKEVHWVVNPTDPRENFADRWEEFPERRDAFREWLRLAREDFAVAARAHDPGRVVEALAPRLGRQLVQRAASRRHALPSTALSRIADVGSRIASVVQGIASAPHRKPAPWSEASSGQVRIVKAVCKKAGFRPKLFASGGPALPKHADLTFEAATSIRRPFKVYWQVTNTGNEALLAPGGRRGDFHEGQATRGNLVRHESTLYSGSHGIECFIVRDGRMRARSGVFVVNIQ